MVNQYIAVLGSLTTIAAHSTAFILNIMEEIWKDIEGYGDRYKISNKCTVVRKECYSTNRHGTVTLMAERTVAIRKKRERNGSWYWLLTLYYEGVCYGKYLHKLMAEAFIPNPQNKPQVNHIDGNKINNDISNLEWCTDLENKQHAKENGLLRSPKYWTGKLGDKHARSKPIVRLGLDMSFKEEYEGLLDACRKGDFSAAGLSIACNNTPRPYKGFIWMFRTDYDNS